MNEPITVPGCERTLNWACAMPQNAETITVASSLAAIDVFRNMFDSLTSDDLPTLGSRKPEDKIEPA